MTFVGQYNAVYFELAAEQIEIGQGHSKAGHAVLTSVNAWYLRIHVIQVMTRSLKITINNMAIAPKDSEPPPGNSSPMVRRL